MSVAFDSADLLDRLGGDVALAQELVALFDEDSPVLISEIQTAIQNTDAEALASSAHAFKGVCANISASQAREVAYALEMAGKTQQLQQAPALMAQLRQAVDAFREAQKDFILITPK
jgi:HPt (histidine-containing phosphotransfer) domain-containing protein